MALNYFILALSWLTLLFLSPAVCIYVLMGGPLKDSHGKSVF